MKFGSDLKRGESFLTGLQCLTVVGLGVSGIDLYPTLSKINNSALSQGTCIPAFAIRQNKPIVFKTQFYRRY